MKPILIFSILVLVSGGFLKKTSVLGPDSSGEDLRWKVFYSPLKNIQNSYSVTDLTLMKDQIKLQYSDTKYEDIRINCLDKRMHPCNIEQYAKKLSNDQAALFLQSAKSFIKKLDGQIDEPDKSCFIVQIGSQTEKRLENYIICALDATSGAKLRVTLIEKYNNFILDLPVERIPDSPSPGEEFKLFITDGITKRSGSFYLKVDQLEDSDFKTVYSFGNIQGDGAQKCSVNVVKPKEVPNKFRALVAEDKACLLLNYNDRNNIACLADENEPVIRIMILGRALREGCLKLGGNKAPSSPSYNKESFLSQTRAENITDGIWKGWGYLNSVQSLNMENIKPIFINLNGKSLEILKNPNSESIQNINLQAIQSSCGFFRICNFNEFLNLKKEDIGLKYALDSVKSWRAKTDVAMEDNCFILEIVSPKGLNVICIYNPNHAANFRRAFEYASVNSTIVGKVDDFEMEEEGKSVEALLIYENKKSYVGTLNVAKEGLLKENKEAVLKYEEVQAINGDRCEVLISNFEIAPALLGERFQLECCIEVKRLGKKLAICESKYSYQAPDEKRAFENPCILSVRKLAAKIRGSCQTQIDAKSSAKLGINGAYNYNKDTVDRSNEGSWAGWIRRGYLEKGEVELLPVFFKIDKEGALFFGPNPQLNSELYDVASIEWPCEGNQFPCTVEEYGAAKKISDFAVRALLLAKKMNIDDYKSCFILPVNGGPQNFICVFDLNQEASIKLAISNAFNINIQVTDADKIPIAELNSQYTIFYYNPLLTSEKVSKAIVTLQGASLVSSEGVEVLKYSDLEELLGVKCGLEFRELALPPGALAQKFNPHCCFAFVKGKQKHFVCVDSPLRCCLKARMLMKRVRMNCLKGKMEVGEVSQKEFISEMAKGSSSSSNENTQERSSASQAPKPGVELVGALAGSGTIEKPESKGVSLLKGAKTSLIHDPWLKNEASKGVWQGKVHFVKVEESPNFYLSRQTGLLAIESTGSVKFAKSLDDLASTDTLKYNILTSHFYCNSPDPCSTKSYLTQRKSDNIEQFAYQSLSKGIESFVLEMRIEKADSCFILEFEQPFVHYFDTFLVCPYDYTEEENIKQAFRTNYDIQIETLDLEDKDAMRNLPLLSDDAKIDIKLLSDDGEAKKMSVKLESGKVTNFNGKTEILSYSGIDFVEKKCMVQDKFEMKAPPGEQDLDTDCCVQVYYFQKPIGLCPASKIRCKATKKMLIKKLRERCLNARSKSDIRSELLKKEDPAQAKLLNNTVTPKSRDVEDSFDFGLKRTEKPQTIDTSNYAADLIDDSENGRWSGWAYSAALTERNPYEKLSLVYMNIDKSFLSLSNAKKDAPFLKYMTLDLKWPCADSPEPCNPSEYLRVNQELSSFSSLEQLKKTIQNLMRQNNNPDVSNCIIVEIENPKLRTVGSELICALERSQIASLKAAFSAAYYNALLEADLSMFPLISSQNEVLEVKLLEEGSWVPLTVFFSRQGVYEKRKEDPNPISVVDYKDFDKDSEGKPCAFWYKSVVLPSNSEVKDRYCCVMWKKKKPLDFGSEKNPSGITMCSSEKYRCLKSARMMAKKIKLDCAAFYKANKAEDFNQFGASENNALAATPLAESSGAGFSDERNGIWKGMVGFMELGKELAPGSVNVFEDEGTVLPDGKKAPPLLELKNENIIISCETDSACTASEYLTQREALSSSKLLTQDLKREVKEFYAKMLPGAANPEEHCTIFDYYIDGSTNSTFMLCSQEKLQGLRLRKALGKGYDLYMKSINLNDVPLASKQDSFTIELYVNGAESSKVSLINLGRKDLIDADSGEKLLLYSDILDDSFGTKCGVWFKNIKAQPKMQFQNIDCCFLLNLPQGQTTVCIARKFHCAYQARILMKSLRVGCMAKESGLELLKSRKDYVSPSPASRNPKTEILGGANPTDLEAKGMAVSKAGGNSSPTAASSLKDALISKAFEGSKKVSKSSKFHHSTADDFSKTDEAWNGWMMVMVLSDVADSSVSPEIQYVKMSKEGIAFGSSPSSLPIEAYKLSDIVKVCAESSLCRPKDFITYYEKAPQQKFDLSALKEFVNVALEYSESGEENCVIAEFLKDENSLRRLFCVVGVDSKYIEEFRALSDKQYKSIMSAIDLAKVNPLQNGERFKLELLQKDKSPKSSIFDCLAFSDGLKKDKNEKVFNYNEVEACEVCYNPGEVQGLRSDSECCSKFKLRGEETYACVNDDSDCEGKLKMMVRKIFDRCLEMTKTQASRKPDVCPEGTSALNRKMEAGSEDLQSAAQPRSMENGGLMMASAGAGRSQGAGNMGGAGGLGNSGMSRGAGNIGGAGTGFDGPQEKAKAQAANKIGDLKNLVNGIGQKTPIKSEQTKEGLIKTNDDGSTTLLKPDGTQVLKEKDGSIMTINTDGSMKVNRNGVLSEVLPDGTVSIKDPSDGSTVKLDSTGTIQTTKIKPDGTMEVVKMDSRGESTAEQTKSPVSSDKDLLSTLVDKAVADPAKLDEILSSSNDINSALESGFSKHSGASSAPSPNDGGMGAGLGGAGTGLGGAAGGAGKGSGGAGSGANSRGFPQSNKDINKNNQILTTAFVGDKKPKAPGSVSSEEFETKLNQIYGIAQNEVNSSGNCERRFG